MVKPLWTGFSYGNSLYDGDEFCLSGMAEEKGEPDSEENRSPLFQITVYSRRKQKNAVRFPVM